MAEPAAPAAPRHKDWTAGLMFFGAIELLIALFFLATAAFLLLSQASPALRQAQAQAGGGLSGSMLGMALVSYGGLAATFGTLGVGSFLCRRWARAVMLVVSWFWLLAGACGCAVIVVLVPRLFANLPQPEGAPRITGCVTAVAVLTASLFYVLLPLAFVLFYRSPHVKATCEAKDPRVRWTDRVPLPVLGLVLALGGSAVSCLFGLGYRALPLFGKVLTGLPAALAFFVLAAIYLALAVGAYRLRPAAWWGTVALSAMMLGFTLSTFRNPGTWRGMYAAMGTPSQQMEAMEKLGIFELLQSPLLTILVVAMWGGILGYLIWVKRYFTPAPPVPTPA